MIPVVDFVVGAHSQEAITKRALDAWPESSQPVSGAVEVAVTLFEAEPATGTRTRRYPHGEPTMRTVLGRVERSLVDAGVLRSPTQVVGYPSCKRWGVTDAIQVRVYKP